MLQTETRVTFRERDVLARLELLEPRAQRGEVGARGGVVGPAVAHAGQQVVVGLQRARVRPERLLALAPRALHALHYVCEQRSARYDTAYIRSKLLFKRC